MHIKRILILLVIPFLFFPRFLPAQVPTYCATSNEAKIKEFDKKIRKVAAELGIPVYEQWPEVVFDENRVNLKAPVYSGGARDYRSLFPFPVPEPAKAENIPAMDRTRWSRIKALREKVRAGTGYALVLSNSLFAHIADSGVIPWTDGVPSFEFISQKVLKVVMDSKFRPGERSRSSLFTDTGFIEEFENVTKARFFDSNHVDFLIDGPEAFKMKDALIKNAKKSILVSVWAFEDDITGREMAQALVAKKREGLEVKVIVDHKVAHVHGVKVIRYMRENGVEVLRYAEKDRRGDYWHVKLAVVDDAYAIVGGMNYGDCYSHKKTGGYKWRDTDVFYSGPAAAESRRIFARIWNSQIEENGLDYKKMDLTGVENPQYAGGGAKISIVFQNPPENSDILTSIVKAIYGASTRVNIENAYYVAIPVVTRAILDARARGVEVNILTNSPASIDAETSLIINPILNSLKQVYNSGVNIYLKKGQTLHSKFMTVDGVYASIGSYNLHPRSERYDSEMNVNILGREYVKELDAAFEKDIAAAKKVVSEKDLKRKFFFIPSILEEYVGDLFYSQLSPQRQI